MEFGGRTALIDEALVDRVEQVEDDVIDAGAGVNKRFRPFDPDAVMLVPPSLDDWLPQNHLARFIAGLVDDELDLSRFYKAYGKAKGQPPYDPRLMLRVLLYGYCVGVRSSRELERACVDVVAFRWLAGQQAPDFRSIGRFRKRHLAAFGNIFLQALLLCRAAGMVSLGQVALDGTKVRANASRHKAMSYARLREKEKVLADEVSDLLAEAARVDADEDARFGPGKRGDEIPEELTRRRTRLAKMAVARASLEAEANEKAAWDLAEKEAKAARKSLAKDPGNTAGTPAGAGSGPEPTQEPKPEQEPEPEPESDAAVPAGPVGVVKPTAQRNFTDPDSRIMKTADGSYHYCYNAQNVVDADHQVIIATEVNNAPVDVQQLIPVLAVLDETLGGDRPAQILADTGYCSDANLAHAQAIEETNGSTTEFFIATGRLKHGQTAETAEGGVPPDASRREQMSQRLKTQTGHDVYARRKAIVEPVFGQIHTRQGKYFGLRGLEQVKHEWDLIAGCHNLLKLFANGSETLAAT